MILRFSSSWNEKDPCPAPSCPSFSPAIPIHWPKRKSSFFQASFDCACRIEHAVSKATNISRIGLLHKAATINELLRRSPRRMMQLFRALFNAKAFAELVMKRVRVVAHHIQATAFHRTLRPESADDHMAAPFDGLEHRVDIQLALSGIGEKVKHRAIVPHIE